VKLAFVEAVGEAVVEAVGCCEPGAGGISSV